MILYWLFLIGIWAYLLLLAGIIAAVLIIVAAVAVALAALVAGIRLAREVEAGERERRGRRRLR